MNDRSKRGMTNEGSGENVVIRRIRFDGEMTNGNLKGEESGRKIIEFGEEGNDE